MALGHLVEPLGRGLFSLRVPFPLPRWQYALSWPVAPGPGEGDPRWSRDLAANAAAIHNAICRSLYDRGGGGLPEDASVSLYLRSKTTKNRLSCAGQQGKAPDSLDFDEQSGIVRGAWWGRRPRAAAPEESDASGLFVEGDSYVALVPLLQPDSGMYPAAGLVRIAVRDRLLDSQKDHVSQISALRSIIGRIPPVWYR